MARSIAVLTAGTLALTAAAPGLVGAQAPPETIGVTAAVLPDTTGTLPSGRGQVLRLGSEVFRGERVKTSRSGVAQLLFFLNEKQLKVWPSSEVVLNDYRYDPRTGLVQLAATIVSGTVQATTAQMGPSPSPAGVAPGGGAPGGAAPGGGAPGGVAPGGVAATPSAPVAPNLASRPADLYPAPNQALDQMLPREQTGFEVMEFRTKTTTRMEHGAKVLFHLAASGELTVLSLSNRRVLVSNDRGERRLMRRGEFMVKVSAQGGLSAPVRASRAEIDALLSPGDAPAAAGQREANLRTLDAIGRQNSALTAPQLAPSRTEALRAIDPRDLDSLAGLQPWRQNDLRQAEVLRSQAPSATTPTIPTTPTRPTTPVLAPPGGTSVPPAAPPPPIVPTRPSPLTIPTVPAATTFPSRPTAPPPVVADQPASSASGLR